MSLFVTVTDEIDRVLFRGFVSKADHYQLTTRNGEPSSVNLSATALSAAVDDAPRAAGEAL